MKRTYSGILKPELQAPRAMFNVDIRLLPALGRKAVAQTLASFSHVISPLPLLARLSAIGCELGQGLT